MNKLYTKTTCSVYPVYTYYNSMVEGNDTVSWNSENPVPDLLMKIRDNASVVFNINNYHNCNMSDFLVECQNTVNIDERFKLPCSGTKENCVSNSLHGNGSYECRAMANLAGKGLIVVQTNPLFSQIMPVQAPNQRQ